MLFLFILCVILAVIVFAQNILHYREKRELYDRIMAADLGEFKRFRDEFPVEVDHKKKALEGQREARKNMTAQDRRVEGAGKGF